jgi:hypothetical protein
VAGNRGVRIRLPRRGSVVVRGFAIRRCERIHRAFSWLVLTGDRGFESISLQRRVSCEPDFLALSLAVSLTCSGIPRIEPSREAGGTPALWRPMTARHASCHRLIISHPKHAVRRLDPVAGAPPGYERARECGVGEVKRDGVVKPLRASQTVSSPKHRHRSSRRARPSSENVLTSICPTARTSSISSAVGMGHSWVDTSTAGHLNRLTP